MSIGDIRDIVIIVYGILGVFLLLSVIILAIFIYTKVASILDDVKSITDRAKLISSYASKEIIEPLIGLSVIIESATEGVRQFGRIFTGRRRKE